jgi:hypothetical protein
MASNPTPPSNDLDEKPLTAEEGWALFWSLEGSMKGWFPEEGGASGILRKETRRLGRMKADVNQGLGDTTTGCCLPLP